MGAFNLTDTELEIMKLLWSSDKRLTFREILDYFNEEKGKNWQRQTLRTQMFRLTEKGFIDREKEGEYLVYWPLVDEKENAKSWTRNMLDKLYEGSIKNLILSMSGGSKLDKKDIDELREFIDEDIEDEK